ncbi:hypothetical protein MEN41_18105 [Dolichospermum sp. ST_con]|nr:hypothetical protein [Dolichospermum sp. ST_con]MDD1420295.1 hypothetical protein [Dolichospermum sp. ST_sed1]MDD1426326.1 hypothetical protein [Dolichospermum sp. ST_sed9]MDD1430056.1 hypothetical protein [Dolichospermum sp. ST_sed6]MDD1441884.1 hypothetical protein [Dolichospermum sp. ST_sed3]MDD1447717.1 hypothetical protein [Dolichospermum sp. ST_sed8]MDD1456707.1 hypothetical protein [Dolichospermum sp. ST_sed7]MDD1462078.1 hypothetical protein [Dolichospermum sp. ST_sed2]MDD1465874
MDILFIRGEKSKNIIGCYGNIEGIAAVVVTVFPDNSKYEIIDSIFRRRVGLKPIADDLLELADIHKVKYIIGNQLVENVYRGGTLEKNYEFPVEIQWETNEINVEKFLFLTECYFNESRLKLSADVEDIIEKELKSFDLQKYRDYGQASHRLFAFFHAIAAARPSIPTWAKS